MKTLSRVCLAAALAALPILAQDTAQPSPIDWQAGPSTARIGAEAQFEIPEGFLFTGPAGARKFLELTENVPSGDELGILMHEQDNWWVIFTFDEVGYVKDDEKDALDAEDLMESMVDGNKEGNDYRRERGWGTISLGGWIVKPHYEETTHNLEWSLRIIDDATKGESANHHTRYLGRGGVMNVELVAGTDEFQAVLPQFRTAMNGFSYVQGRDYLSFVQGDKVAEYGLTALVLGGAAAAAAKTGLLKGLWKLLLAGWKVVALGVVALAGAIKKFFMGKKPSPESPEPIS